MASLADLVTRQQRATTRVPARARTATAPRPGGSAGEQQLLARLSGRSTPAAATVPTQRGGLTQDRIDYLNSLASMPAPTTRRTRGPKPRSLFGQIKDTVASIPQGIATLAWEGAHDVTALPRLGIDIVTGNLPDTGNSLFGEDLYPNATPELRAIMEAQGVETYKPGLLGPGGFTDRYIPLTSAIARSGEQTINRARQLATGDLSAYREAIEEGRIVDVLVEDVSNVALAGGAVGKALGRVGAVTEVTSPGMAAAVEGRIAPRAVGSAVAEGAQVRPLIPPRSAVPVTVTEAGKVVPKTYVARAPGTGLAGVLQESAPRLAQGVSRTGEAVSKVARWGETVDDLTFAWPARGAAYLARKSGLSPRVAKVASAAMSRIASSDTPYGRAAQRYAPEFREQVRGADTAREAVEKEKTAAARTVIESLVIAQRDGLSSVQQDAAIWNVDQRFVELGNIYRKARADGLDVKREIGDVIERAWGDEPSSLRPTIEHVEAFVDWQDGALDPKVAASMSQVDEAMREWSGLHTQQLVKGKVLRPEQTDNQMLPYRVSEIRAELERNRESALREWEGQVERADKIARRASARELANADLPSPRGDVPQLVEGAERSGLAHARGVALRRAHADKRTQLNRALQRYERAATMAEPGSAYLRPIEAEIDRLSDEVRALEGEVARTERRQQAAVPLSRVTGVRDVAQRVPEVDRPTPDLSEIGTVGGIREMVRQLTDEAGLESWGFIEHVSGGEKPLLTGQWGEFGNIRSEARKKAYSAGGFLADGKKVKGWAPDQFAQIVSDRLGRDLSVYEALDTYFGAIDQHLDQKARASQTAAIEVGERLGLPAEVVEVALTGTAKDFRRAMSEAVVDALDDVRAAFNDMDPTVRDGVFNEFRDMRQRGASPDEVRDLIYDALEELGPGAHLLEPIWNTVNPDDIALWLTGHDIPDPIYEAVLGKRGAAQNQLLGRLQGQLVELRRSARATQGHQQRMSTLYERATRQLARQESAAIRDLNDAASAEARAAEAAANAPTVEDIMSGRGGPWARYQAYHPSTGETMEVRSAAERATWQEGAMRNRSNAATAQRDRIARRVARWNQKIVDLDTELGRAWVERLRTDINEPAMRGMANTIRSIAREFGGVQLRSLSQGGPRLNGVVGRMADKYRITDEVIASITAEMRSVPGDWTAKDTARAWQRVVDERRIPIEKMDADEIAASWQTDHLLSELSEIVRQSQATRTAANAPFRFFEHIDSTQWIDDNIRAYIVNKYERYLRQRGKFLTTLFDQQAAVMPGQWRAVAANNRRAIQGLLDQAEDAYKRQDYETATILLTYAEDVPTTLQGMVDAGLDPAHLYGGKDKARAGTRQGAIEIRKLKATQQLTSGVRPMSLAGVVRSEINEVSKFLTNQTSRNITEQVGVRADRVIADAFDEWREAHPLSPVMPAEDVRKALDEAGWAIASGEDAAAAHRGTIVIPTAVDVALKKAAAPNGLILSILSKGNQVWKQTVLPLSTKWLTGNMFGNAFMANVYGGIGPVELARTLDEIAKMEGGWAELYRRGGLPSWAPSELSSHGFTYNEYSLQWGDQRLRGTDLGADRRIVADNLRGLIEKSYGFNEFVDNATRSAVYLSGLRKGMSPEAAAKKALNAMGNFTKMTPWERRVAREIFPFYAWLRHQTTAMMRLPLYSPTRAAWLMHVGNLFTDPEMSNEMFAILGSRVPTGTNTFLNLGGISPFPNPLNLPLDPTSAGQFAAGVSPVIDVTAKLGLGVDLARGSAVTRPREDRATDQFGRITPLSPFRRMLGDPIGGLGEIAYTLAGEVPYTRAARDIALGTDVARYGSGDDTGFRRPRSLHEVIASGVGFPMVEHVDVEQEEREIRRRARENRR